MHEANRANPENRTRGNHSHWMNRFWFDPVRSEPLALFRIVGSLGLLHHVLFNIAADPVDNSLWVHGACVSVWSLALIALLVGWRTRFSALAAFLFALFTPGAFQGIGDVPVQLSFYLALAPVGSSWSLDSLRVARHSVRDPEMGFETVARRPIPSPIYVAPWSLRFLQIYVVANYFLMAFMLTGAGDTWHTGELLFGALANPYVARFSPEVLPISVGVCQVLTYVAVMWAVAMPALAFQTRTIAIMLRLGVILHIGILLLFDMGWSGHFLLAFYPLFLTGEAVSRGAMGLSRSLSDGTYLVAYDTFCPLCRRSRLMLERMDIGQRLRFVDIHDREAMSHEFVAITYAQCLEELQVKHPNGTITGGYFAFRTLSRVLPALRPIRLVLYVPGVPQAGQFIYRWIAKHRYRLVGCSSEVCSLHVRALSQANIDEKEIAAIVERARSAARDTGL